MITKDQLYLQAKIRTSYERARIHQKTTSAATRRRLRATYGTQKATGEKGMISVIFVLKICVKIVLKLSCIENSGKK